jgi:hypothetical protein
MITYMISGVGIIFLTVVNSLELMMVIFAIIGFTIFPYLFCVVVYASEIGGGDWKYYGI